ncbi:MAG: hypothetical protein GY765_28245, partial [bacterium]|nr:hypothetical protein [bacterium]
MQNELRCPAILGTLIIRTAGVAGPGFYLYSFFATILNGLKEKLEKETVARLKQLARQLGLKGYSGLKKQLLIDFICDNRAPEDITAGLDALNDKPHPWMRIRAFLKKNSAIITAIGTFLGIISILLAVFFFRFSEANRFDSEKAFANLSQKIHTLTPEQIRQRIEQLEKALKDATTGDSKERKEALKALENGDLK